MRLPCRWSDHVIVNSRSCWEGLGSPQNSTWISNGVDREVFRIEAAPEQRTARVIWIGSRLHRSAKRYDDILLPLADELRKRAIDADFRLVDSMGGSSRLSREDLVRWYNTGTIYVVSSRYEGTPNPALEAASAGCALVATPVGNMPELIRNGVNGELVDGTVDDILAAVLRCQDRYPEMAAAMQSELRGWHWANRAQQYFTLFRELIDTQRRSAVPCSPATSSVSVRDVDVTKTSNAYTIITFCSEGYIDALNLVIDSWLLTNASRIVVYTDFDHYVANDRVVIRNHFSPSDDWLQNVGRKTEAVIDYLATDAPWRLAFLDVDCYVRADFSEIFDLHFDLAVTRMHCSEAYTNGTITSGVWFSNNPNTLVEFLHAWQERAAEYRSAGHGCRPHIISHDQYAFTDLVREYSKSKALTIQPLDERVYNCEHSDAATWERYAADHKPKIIHFKGGRFRRHDFVQRILSLARPTAILHRATRTVTSARKVKSVGSHLPLLKAVLDHVPHRVIVECGMGECSTPFLVERALTALISLEHDKDWYSRIRATSMDRARLFARFVPLTAGVTRKTRRPTANVEQVRAMDRTYSAIRRDLRLWGTIDVLFIDTMSAIRLSALIQLHELAPVIIIHDTEPPNFRGYCYDQFVADFGHLYSRYSYRPAGWPWTDVFVRGATDWSGIAESIQGYSSEYFGEGTEFEFIPCS